MTTSLRLDAKLYALLKHAGIHFDLRGSLPQDAIQALEPGNKIEAIKRYGAATGVGLKEAKDFRRGSAITNKMGLTRRLLSSLSQI